MAKDDIIWIEDNTLYFLFKRGNPIHIKSLYEKGELYFSTIDFIRKCDQNEDRTDPNDGIAKRTFLGNVVVKMCDVGKDINREGVTFNANNCVINEDSEKKGNIYCLSGIFSEHLLDERNELKFDTKSFGESIILIYKPKEFINRVIQGLKEHGYENVTFRRVSYYPNEYSGKIGLFRKHEKFSHQNELRFFFQNDKNNPVKICIGSLADIAYIENNTLLKMTYTDGKEKIVKLE